MESRISTLTSNTDQEFNTVAFERKLLQLKDSQESINSLSAWCLENRQHHKKIVTAWLNVLKKVKVEQRLTLFYLANDVIQYSKRKNYDFVGSWGTTLQKATTMVREEKVKNKILRIFKIWEQRGIYGEEFITDLSGLISASPIGRIGEGETQEFQPSFLITRIRSCAKLEENTDLKLKNLKENNPKIIDNDTLLSSLKDRRHVEDVEREVEDGITLIEGYVNALKAEIKSRTHLIALLTQADAFYHTERGEVKVVNVAYRTFTTKVKNVKKKLDEIMPTLSSPIPSPDINAPSPEPDSDMELPLEMHQSTSSLYPTTDSYNADYYNPISQDNQSTQSFNNSTFTSFMNSSSMPFNLENLTANMYNDRQDSMYSTQTTSHDISHHHMTQHEPVDTSVKMPYDYGHQSAPLLPPPMPPFTSSGYMDNSYSDNSYATTDTYSNNSTYQPVATNNYAVTSEIQPTYTTMPPPEAYNPEEDIETWEPENNWDQPPEVIETPESPPIYEKEGFADPIEYDDSKVDIDKDVDHRVLMPPPIPPQLTDHRLPRSGAKDVDHRNLISLTGSPGNEIASPSPPPQSILPPPPAPPSLWTGPDQDYPNQDVDYRIPTIEGQKTTVKSPLIQIPAIDAPVVPINNSQHIVDIAQQLQLPPPPPPPPPNNKIAAKQMKKPSYHDNVESIDMDLSDDENCIQENNVINNHRDPFMNNRTCVNEMLEPPPPIPQNLSGEISFDDNIPGKSENGPMDTVDNHHMNMPPPIPEMLGPPGPLPPGPPFMPGGLPPPMNPMNWNEGWADGRPPEMHTRPPFPPIFQKRHPGDFRGGFRGRAIDHGELFRGRGRGRGFRGMMAARGGPIRGFNRGNRGFRGHFRGGF